MARKKKSPSLSTRLLDRKVRFRKRSIGERLVWGRKRAIRGA